MALFGLVDESTSCNHFFMSDEGNGMDFDGQASHGPDAVLSMLDFYLSTHYNGEETLILYCDNCGGQNKNRFLIGYCADLVKSKRYKKIEVHFLPVGHTKFSPDGFFGLFKRIFRRSTLDLPSQVRHMVGEQVKCSSTFVKGDREMDWPWRNYKAYLEPRYDAIKGIQGSYHFCLTNSPSKGVTLTHTYAEGQDEKQIFLEYVHKQRKGKASEERDECARKNPVPAVIPVAGLSETRKNQLTKDIAHHVSFDKKTAFISYILSIAAKKPAQPTK